MPGRRKRANRTANASIYQYFEKGSAKSKYRGPPKLTSNAAEATCYCEHTVRRIVAEKSEISGAAFTSPPKRWEVKEEYNDDLNTEVLRRLVPDFYREKNAV